MQIIELRESDVKPCKFCQKPVAWLKGVKSGKWYPVNADYAVKGSPATFKTNFHKCANRVVAA